jgi:hypothetical protein
MYRVLAAATLVIAAISPAMAQPSATLLAADSGRSYSGAPVQARQQPSSTTPTPSSPQTRTNSTVEAVGTAAKATSDLIGIFGK